MSAASVGGGISAMDGRARGVKKGKALTYTRVLAWTKTGQKLFAVILGHRHARLVYIRFRVLVGS